MAEGLTAAGLEGLHAAAGAALGRDPAPAPPRGAGGGLIAREEPVDRLLPELSGRRVLRRMDGPLDDTVPADRAITVRDLLTFTFGFGMMMQMFTSPGPWPVVEAAEALHLATIGPPEPDVQPDPDTWIAGLGSLPLLAPPRERWLYNNGP